MVELLSAPNVEEQEAFQAAETIPVSGKAAGFGPDADAGGAPKNFGFSTARGKKIAVSGRALGLAEKRFEADNLITESDKLGAPARTEFMRKARAPGPQTLIEGRSDATKLVSLGPSTIKAQTSSGSGFGFSTAGGKAIPVSTRALRNAEKLHESEIESEFKVPVTRSLKSTASRKSFELATLFFETGKDEEEQEKASFGSVEADQQPGLKPETLQFGFSTAAGKNIEVSKSALDLAQTRFESVDSDPSEGIKKTPTLLGLSTAAGMKVQISKSALVHARMQFAAEVSEPLDAVKKMPPMMGFSTAAGKDIEVSKNALHHAQTRFESVDSEPLDAIKKRPKMLGLSTAAGKKVPISKSALEQARKRFESEPSDVTKKAPTLGFSAAFGKGAEVSKEALDHAKKRFESEVVDTKLGSSTSLGFSTAAGRKVNVSEDSLSKARKLFEEHDELSAGPGTEAPKFAGFASASGKTISVSKEALKEARKIFESEEKIGIAGSGLPPLVANGKIDVSASFANGDVGDAPVDVVAVAKAENKTGGSTKRRLNGADDLSSKRRRSSSDALTDLADLDDQRAESVIATNPFNIEDDFGCGKSAAFLHFQLPEPGRF